MRRGDHLRGERRLRRLLSHRLLGCRQPLVVLLRQTERREGRSLGGGGQPCSPVLSLPASTTRQEAPPTPTPLSLPAPACGEGRAGGGEGCGAGAATWPSILSRISALSSRAFASAASCSRANAAACSASCLSAAALAIAAL